MTGFLRSFSLATIFLGLTFGMICSIAIAKTYHRHSSYAHTHHHTAPTACTPDMVRSAQLHLSHLGYDPGPMDGKVGPKTKRAMNNFQRDNHLSVTQNLTSETYDLLVAMDKAHAPDNILATKQTPEFYTKHPDSYGYIDPNYSDPLAAAPAVASADSTTKSESLSNRFARLDVVEDKQGAMRHYNVSLDGQPLFQADNQPAVIGISRTYGLDSEDAIIFTAYRADSTVCPYKHYLLTLHSGANKLQEIGNCTPGYQAKVTNNSLFIVFPETDDGRPVGNTWRYESGALQRL